MKKKYLLMAFAGGGEIVQEETIQCTEDELDEKLAEFEADTVGHNNGEFVGFREMPSTQNEFADEVDRTENITERLTGLVDRSEDYRNPSLLHRLRGLNDQLSEIVEKIEP